MPEPISQFPILLIPCRPSQTYLSPSKAPLQPAAQSTPESLSLFVRSDRRLYLEVKWRTNSESALERYLHEGRGLSLGLEGIDLVISCLVSKGTLEEYLNIIFCFWDARGGWGGPFFVGFWYWNLYGGFVEVESQYTGQWTTSLSQGQTSRRKILQFPPGYLLDHFLQIDPSIVLLFIAIRWQRQTTSETAFRTAPTVRTSTGHRVLRGRCSSTSEEQYGSIILNFKF